MKTHFFKVKPNAYGGFNTSTICDRYSQASEDGFNSTDDPTKVTCKHCLRIMPIRPLFDFSDFQDWVMARSTGLSGYRLPSTVDVGT